MEMQGPLFKNHYEMQDSDNRTSKYRALLGAEALWLHRLYTCKASPPHTIEKLAALIRESNGATL
jgi:hypothetical protein